jgi:hypothetical protein
MDITTHATSSATEGIKTVLVPVSGLATAKAETA